MVQRLDLTSLTPPEDEEHTEAATDVPMQMSLVSVSSLAAKVRYAASGFINPVFQQVQCLQVTCCEVLPIHLVMKIDHSCSCRGCAHADTPAVFATAYVSSRHVRQKYFWRYMSGMHVYTSVMHVQLPW